MRLSLLAQHRKQVLRGAKTYARLLHDLELQYPAVRQTDTPRRPMCSTRIMLPYLFIRVAAAASSRPNGADRLVSRPLRACSVKELT